MTSPVGVLADALPALGIVAAVLGVVACRSRSASPANVGVGSSGGISGNGAIVPSGAVTVR